LFTFTLLAPAALHEAVSGNASCGCFGQLRTNPWFTTAFDFAALIGIIACCSIGLANVENQRLTLPRIAAMTGVVLVMTFAGFQIAGNRARSRIKDDGITEFDHTTLLEPEKWVGKRLVLSKHIDIESTIMKGRWIVVLYRADCEHCRRAIPRYEELAERREDRDPSVALIELPPYSSPDGRPISVNSAARSGRLSDGHKWIVKTPVLLHLEDGKVVMVADDDRAEYPEPW
jgi:hypothetical protein